MRAHRRGRALVATLLVMLFVASAALGAHRHLGGHHDARPCSTCARAEVHSTGAVHAHGPPARS